MALTIGVDVGGTKIAAGVVDEGGALLDHIRRPTPGTSVEATEDAIADCVRELRTRHDVAAVGIGAAGFVDAARSRVVFAPNLAWRDEPLRDAVAQRVGIPVVVENDANCAAWAEYRYGAGRTARDLVVVTVGTGIGGGIVVDGCLLRGAGGMAAEIGHIRVVPDGRRCGCGNRGCWEQYCSGRALAREAQEIAMASPVRGAGLLERAGGEVGAITGPLVMAAGQEGDPAAIECYAVIGRWLGQGLADLSAVLDPSCVVVGGGVAEAGDLLLDPAREALAAALTGRGFRPVPEIRAAILGNEAGLVGAADLARQP